MKKFLVLYLIPPLVIEDWLKTAPDVRKAAQEKMRGEWNAWVASHVKMITDTAAGGKTKLVSTSGVSDTKNDIMLYSFVEADSHEAAAKAFEGHPHLQIPQSSIEVMEVRAMAGAYPSLRPLRRLRRRARRVGPRRRRSRARPHHAI